MKHKIFYGNEPRFTDADREMFSDSRYDCKLLLKNKKGAPVAISKSKDPDFPVWRVTHNFSCMVFATYEEALEYCKGRCFYLDGKAV